MRAKRETTYGMPARILANANHGRITQATHDHDAAHHEPCRHAKLLRHTHWAAGRHCEMHPHGAGRVGHPACRAGRPCATDPGARAAGVAPHPRPRWPRPLAEHAVRVRPQVADHAER